MRREGEREGGKEGWWDEEGGKEGWWNEEGGREGWWNEEGGREEGRKGKRYHAHTIAL